MLSDTIAAISTPYSAGGIGIIRISGDNAAVIARKIFTGEIDKSHTIGYGFVFNPITNEKIDEVLVSYMKAPMSYTKEDIVEINCHSGQAVLNKIMELVLCYGARLAENGEFTKRAFLNGRIDLTKAEAVIDLINAKTEASRLNAVNQLSGSLYNEIKAFSDRILLMLANIEVSIDYPEHSEDTLLNCELTDAICGILEDVRKLSATADKGRILKEGIGAVITGRTNVGKSSLLNYLARAEKAIVTDIAGTTRDILEETVNLDGVLLKLIDTAGIRDTKDPVETIGIDRAKKAVLNGDIVLVMFDGSKELIEEDLYINTKGVKLALINKSDLENKIDSFLIKKVFGDDNVFFISAKSGYGLTGVAQRIKELFYTGEINNTCIITNMRHKEALLRCTNNLEEALNGIKAGYPADIAAISLTEAYSNLCEITGDDVKENLVDKIFSEFCLGK